MIDIKIAEKVFREDPEVLEYHKQGKSLIFVALSTTEESMLRNAFEYTADGDIRQLISDISLSPKDNRAMVEIMPGRNADPLFHYHETRNNTKNHRPNGISVDLGYTPFVVFFNDGEEPLTVDGKWVKPAGYTYVRDATGTPEAQAALNAFVEEQSRMMKDDPDWPGNQSLKAGV